MNPSDPEHARPRRTWGPYLLVGVLLLTVLGACELSGWRFLRQPLERVLSQRLAQPVALGPGVGALYPLTPSGRAPSCRRPPWRPWRPRQRRLMDTRLA